MSLEPSPRAAPAATPAADLGLADLVRIRGAGGTELLQAAADQLGLPILGKRQEGKHADGRQAQGVAQVGKTIEPGDPAPVGTGIDAMPALTFWMATELVAEAPPEETEQARRVAQIEDSAARELPRWPSRPPPPARYAPLNTWPALLPRLRTAFAADLATRTPDVARIVARLSRGELLERVPFRRTRRWGAPVQILDDRSRHLVPYWHDQGITRRALRDLFPAHARIDGVVDEALILPRALCRQPGWPLTALNGYTPPPPGGVLVALGDLGVLAAGGARARDFWLELGQRIRQAGARAAALVPFAPQTAPDAVRAVWTLIPWERSAIAMTPAQRELWLRQLAWHGSLPDEVRFGEAALLSEASSALLDAAEREARDAFFAALEARLAAGQGLADGVVAWFRRLERRAVKTREPVWRKQPMHRLWAAMVADEQGGEPPPEFDLRDIDGEPNSDTITIAVGQRGAQLLICPSDRQQVPTGDPASDPMLDGPPSSPLGRLTSRNRWLGVEPIGEPGDSDPDPAFWESGAPPAWAARWGWDQYGAWVELEVAGEDGELVTQRMRWIPPGRFWMGSPEDEPGRYDDEGPRQEALIAQGYWLFDTPCTQALWEAVLGEHESRFRDPQRPVERVTWEDAQRFVEALHERLLALDDDGGRIVLPSEAQWEYACRAGTATALYTGPIEIRGDVATSMDAPALDPIAWYGGNSGVDYDLDEYEDSSTGWWGGRQKQYPHTRAGTRKVRQKMPNPWGLYDMLGNVYEWVQDHWHDSYEGAPTDGTAWVDAKADAVAGRAVRGRGGPDDRYDDLGFRPARAQVS